MTRAGFTLCLAIVCSATARCVASADAGPAAAAAPSVPTAVAPGSLDALCEYGIAVALMGRNARAESVFVDLLSRSPGDARALNNLGNVALLRGEPDLAMSFYERAAERDSADAGVILNEAIALMLLGDEAAAREGAAEGIRRAGSPQAAGYLLGLEYSGGERPKASSPSAMSKDELTALLQAAAGQVPSDSTRAGAAVPGTVSKGTTSTHRAPVWRSAGARAGNADAAATVYWKH